MNMTSIEKTYDKQSFRDSVYNLPEFLESSLNKLKFSKKAKIKTESKKITKSGKSESVVLRFEEDGKIAKFNGIHIFKSDKRAEVIFIWKQQPEEEVDLKEFNIDLN